ncbi:AAA family ATPase [Providencia sp. PROV273]|uniref:AAA family ATPase n=1 Tax=Providencia sp. PROV273 TaxID=2949960 RepID=UPI00234B52A6|nr:ATP-binding protein [Providencia sp. PROV273]
MLILEQLKIQDISCVKNLSINFNRRLNFICGSNGIGKTSILESIAGFFYGHYTNDNIKKRFSSEAGYCSATFDFSDTKEIFAYKVDSFHPKEGLTPSINRLYDVSDEVIFIKTNRDIVYEELNQIALKNERGGYQKSEDLKKGLSGKDIKNWFIQRTLFSKQDNGLSFGKLENLRFATDAFSIVDGRFKYSHLDADRHDIVISTPSGEICFEYLSSGFKSCLYLIIGLIKEIDYRFPNVNAREFAGIILIDEPEIHLHPAWQAKIAGILSSAFKNAQFICATHSPHIIQEASADEVITLEFDEKSEVRVKELAHKQYGFKGWTVEEILTDVMGMELPRSSFYISLKNSFYKALDEGNGVLAGDFYNKLMLALHENNPEKRIIKIDMACFVGGQCD